jgi:hypothetical protein
MVRFDGSEVNLLSTATRLDNTASRVCSKLLTLPNRKSQSRMKHDRVTWACLPFGRSNKLCFLKSNNGYGIDPEARWKGSPSRAVVTSLANFPRSCYEVGSYECSEQFQQGHWSKNSWKSMRYSGWRYNTSLELKWPDIESRQPTEITWFSSRHFRAGNLGPEPAGLPTDSLQPNSNLLQRNSNITAAEFQQFHILVVLLFILHCAGLRGIARALRGIEPHILGFLSLKIRAKLDLLVRN